MEGSSFAVMLESGPDVRLSRTLNNPAMGRTVRAAWWTDGASRGASPDVCGPLGDYPVLFAVRAAAGVICPAFLQFDPHGRAAALVACDLDLAAPALHQLPADREAQTAAGRARREVRLEDTGQDSRGNPLAVVRHFDHDAAVVPRQAHEHARGRRESRILEHVEQHFAQLVGARFGEERLVGAVEAPLDRAAAAAHALEVEYVARHGGDVHGLGRLALGGSGAVAAERARDFVEAVDLGQDAAGVLLEDAIEIAARVGVRALEVLHA